MSSVVHRTEAMPREGLVEAFDAGWNAHEVGLERETVEVLTPPSGRGWAILGWDCRALAANRLAFKHTVLRLDRGCVAHMLHGKCGGPLQAHHAITQQVLRRWKLDHLLWDPNVGVTVCERAHARHHSRLEPLPLAVLPKRVLGFAREHGFSEWLERVYAGSVSPREGTVS